MLVSCGKICIHNSTLKKKQASGEEKSVEKYSKNGEKHFKNKKWKKPNERKPKFIKNLHHICQFPEEAKCLRTKAIPTPSFQHFNISSF